MDLRTSIASTLVLHVYDCYPELCIIISYERYYYYYYYYHHH